MKSKAVLRELQNRYNKYNTSLPEPTVRSLRYIRCSRLFINESEAFVTQKSPLPGRKSRHRGSVFGKRGHKHMTTGLVCSFIADRVQCCTGKLLPLFVICVQSPFGGGGIRLSNSFSDFKTVFHEVPHSH
jgi:hypothetical protein